MGKMEKEVKMSALGKTWFFDLDGTLVKHNGYKLDGEDSFLPGAKEFLQALPENDRIIFATSRKNEIVDGIERRIQEETEAFLEKNGIRYDQIIYGLPFGERILVNDSKPSGLKMAYAFAPERDKLFEEKIVIDENL